MVDTAALKEYVTEHHALIDKRFRLWDEGAQSTVNKKGFIYAGGGAYSRVWSHIDYPDFVIKTYPDDKGYDTFLHAVRNLGECEHFPKVHEHWSIANSAKKQTIVILEKLIPLGVFDENIVIKEYGPPSTLWWDCVAGKFSDENSFAFAISMLALEVQKIIGHIPGCDLHFGNIMWRVNNDQKVLVVTDPLGF